VIDNRKQTYGDPSSGAIAINADDISVRGVEATLIVMPTHDLTLNLGGSYIDQKTRKTTYGALAPTIIANGEDPAKVPFPSFAMCSTAPGRRLVARSLLRRVS
jgi:outer membrane receptor protein involved in Fe transport